MKFFKVAHVKIYFPHPSFFNLKNNAKTIDLSLSAPQPVAKFVCFLYLRVVADVS